MCHEQVDELIPQRNAVLRQQSRHLPPSVYIGDLTICRFQDDIREIVAYFLEALIFHSRDVDGDALPARVARIVPISFDLSLLPVTDELIAEAKQGAGQPPRPEASHSPLPPRIESWARQASRRGCIGYIAAEYFGGCGDQFSIAWSGGELVLGPLRQPDAINQVLRLLGVEAIDGKDEFDSIGLGRHRHTHEWV